MPHWAWKVLEGRVLRISMRASYGVRAMMHLALFLGSGPVQSGEVARAQMIPAVYLDQVFSALRKAGLVKSTRGPQGGHELARPAHAISVLDIVAALDGPPQLADAAEDPAVDELNTAHAVRPVWEKLRDAIETTLSGVSLAELAERAREVDQRPAYSI